MWEKLSVSKYGKSWIWIQITDTDYNSGLQNMDLNNYGHDRLKMDQEYHIFVQKIFHMTDRILDQMYIGWCVIAVLRAQKSGSKGLEAWILFFYLAFYYIAVR